MPGKNRKRRGPKRIVQKLAEADRLLNAGQSVGQVFQVLGVSEATYRRWRNQYGGVKASEAKRLKDLGAADARLKNLLPDAYLDNGIHRPVPDHLGSEWARLAAATRLPVFSVNLARAMGFSATVDTQNHTAAKYFPNFLRIESKYCLSRGLMSPTLALVAKQRLFDRGDKAAADKNIRKLLPDESISCHFESVMQSN